MDTFDNNDAIRLILAGLQSGSIKLCGSSATPETAAKLGQSDATYLLTLLAALQKPQEP